MYLKELDPELVKQLTPENKALLVNLLYVLHDKLRNIRRALVVFGCILAFGCAWGLYSVKQIASDNRDLIVQFQKDSKERRNQSCLGSEKAYAQKVKQISQTYGYLNALPENERGQTLNQFIIRALPTTIADAKSAKNPLFCDEPGIGLPEPDPKFPKIKDYSGWLVNKDKPKTSQ